MLTRFAPAPTGWLHLGHVRNAEFVWSSGADVLLRIEDHDRERCRPEFEAGILEDLDWLGYRPDFPIVRQGARDAIYRDALAVLAAQGLVYGCDCTRKEIEARGALARRRLGEGGRTDANELFYSGHCGHRGVHLTEGVGSRVRMDPGVETFVDGILGPQEQDLSLIHI